MQSGIIFFHVTSLKNVEANISFADICVCCNTVFIEMLLKASIALVIDQLFFAQRTNNNNLSVAHWIVFLSKN